MRSKVVLDSDRTKTGRCQHFCDFLRAVKAYTVSCISDQTFPLGDNNLSTVNDILILPPLTADYNLFIHFMPGLWDKIS